MADANRCPSCGAERPANAPEGYCPRCLLSQATNSDTPGRVDVDATTAPATTSSGHEPETLPGDSEATGAYIPGPAAGAASSRTDATGDWTTDSDDPHAHHRRPTARPARPMATRILTTCRAAPPSATSAITRS